MFNYQSDLLFTWTFQWNHIYNLNNFIQIINTFEIFDLAQELPHGGLVQDCGKFNLTNLSYHSLPLIHQIVATISFWGCWVS